MFAPAGQTTARAGLRSKLAALVVRRQAPPNPRRGEVEAPCQRVTPRCAGRCRGATEGPGPEGLSPLGDWGIPTGLTSPPVPGQPPANLEEGGLPPSLAPLVRNPFTAVRRGRACPARGFAMLPVNGLNPSGLLRGHLP